MIGVLLIALFFNKIDQLNQEYMTLIDDSTVQLQDFGLMI